MLSYRHGFHAGNHADVLKHAIFVFLARHLQRKAGGVLFLDTHAGAGLYDLRAAAAEKTGEFREGIARVLPRKATAPALLRDYLALVEAWNPSAAPTTYPGSPALAAAFRRPQDRVVLFELHPTDFQCLADHTRREKRLAIHHADGLKGLLAHVPPIERRGLFLIDPSYEIKDDYEDVVATLIKAWRKFATGVYALWYPVIERRRVHEMETALRKSGARKIYRVEFCVAPDTRGHGMTGGGLFILNPPFTLAPAVAGALPWLAETLGAKGPVRADWLVPE